MSKMSFKINILYYNKLEGGLAHLCAIEDT